MRFRLMALYSMLFAVAGPNMAIAQAAPASLDNLRDLSKYLNRCWVSPRLKPGTPDTKITVLMSFKRSGELLGRPKVTFQTPGPSEEELSIRKAAALAIMRCTPLPITEAFGSAIAGQTFRITFELTQGRQI